MSFNWGKGIVIVFTSFVLLISFLVFKAVRSQIDLVSEDYYANELQYQAQIDKMENALALKKPLTWAIEADQIQIHFPEGDVHGNINFFRPSDARLDTSRPVSADELGIQRIALADLTKGKYRMQIDWQQGDQKFFTEQIIVIP